MFIYIIISVKVQKNEICFYKNVYDLKKMKKIIKNIERSILSKIFITIEITVKNM